MAGVLLPPALALVLFAAAVGAVIVPATEQALLERKRETLRAIVGAATTLLGRHAELAARNGIPDEQARQSAIEDLRGLRYGDEGKDYLWILDRDLRMVLHPYRPDLEGQSLTDYRDQAGKRVFAESWAAIATGGEGYVEYLWQWQDDPDRIEPKLSYIREFKPWGWAVGTGLYLDDVRADLRRVTWRLYGVASLAGAGMLVFLIIGMRRSWRTELQRQAAETELAGSRERYRALAQASADMAILFFGGRVAGANRAACEWLGLSESELLARPVEQVLDDQRDADLIRAVHEAAPAAERETLLKGRTDAVPVLLSCSLVHLGGETAVLLAGRDLRPTTDEGFDTVSADAAGLGHVRFRLDRRMTVLQATPHATRLLTEGGDQGGTGLELLEVLSESEAAALRHELTIGPAVSGMMVGTRSDRALRVWASRTTSATGPAVCEGYLAEATEEWRRLQAGMATSLADDETQGDLQLRRLRAQNWAAAAVRAGRHPELVTGPLGHVLDRLFRQACALALREAGPPPAPVTLLAVGSIGRGEPALNPDQDTALMLADGADYGDWPGRFGTAVTAHMEAAGLPPCNAGHTAAQADWHLTQAEWRERFAQWIRAAEPKALMEVNVFFDLRALWGPDDPAEELRRFIFDRVGERPVVLRHLAAYTMEFRSPLDPLGRIRPDHPGEDHLDVKGAMMHIVNFARIYGLRHRIYETGTAARLAALGRSAHLPSDTVRDTLDAWRHLSGLRLRLQVEHLDRGLAPSNLAVLSSLSPWDSAVLKLALAQIGHLQQRLESEILNVA